MTTDKRPAWIGACIIGAAVAIIAIIAIFAVRNMDEQARPWREYKEQQAAKRMAEYEVQGRLYEQMIETSLAMKDDVGRDALVAYQTCWVKERDADYCEVLSVQLVASRGDSYTTASTVIRKFRRRVKARLAELHLNEPVPAAKELAR